MVKRVRRVRRVVRRRRITSHEKGHLFEEVVEKYFQILGYSVVRNARVKGLSGATHEIDVLLERNGVKGVVEAKNYSKPVPKEWVMKAHSVAKDIGAQEVYVVSASGFTEDAVKIAEVLGAKLLNLDDMVKEVRRASYYASLRQYHVEPAVKPRSMREHAEKHVVKKLFKPVERVDSVEVLYYPFYVLDTEYVYVEETGIIFTREVERRVRVPVVVDAVTGSLLVLGEDYAELCPVAHVTKDEAELLSTLSESPEPLTASELEKELGWSRQKVASLLQKLAEKGLVEYEEVEASSGRKVREYYSNVPHIEDVKATGDEVVSLLVEGRPGTGVLVEPRVPVSNVASAVASLYGVKVHDKVLAHLPFYKVKYTSLEDGSYRYLYFTAFTEPPLPVEGLELD